MRKLEMVGMLDNMTPNKIHVKNGLSQELANAKPTAQEFYFKIMKIGHNPLKAYQKYNPSGQYWSNHGLL